ncbi:hypothetical protein Tco_0848137 [Tanacetum coccineum]
MSSTRLSLLGDRGGELTLSSLDVLQGFSFFLQMGFTLILATLDSLDVGLLGDVIGEDDCDDDEVTLDPLMKNVPVIVLSDEDSDVPATNKRRRLTKNGSIENDNVHIISFSDDVVLPLSIKKTNQKEIVKNEKMESDDEYTDEDIVDSQVAGDEVVPHSNDSINNEADDEYDYSDSFIDDGPILDEPTS